MKTPSHPFLVNLNAVVVAAVAEHRVKRNAYRRVPWGGLQNGALSKSDVVLVPDDIARVLCVQGKAIRVDDDDE